MYDASDVNRVRFSLYGICGQNPLHRIVHGMVSTAGDVAGVSNWFPGI